MKDGAEKKVATAQSGEDKSKGWGRDIFLLFAGVVIGFFLNVWQEDIVTFAADKWCDGSNLLAKGKAARKEAVEAELKSKPPRPAALTELISSKHKEANEAFKAASTCRVPEAGLRYGQAHCFGWAVPRDPKQGWVLILDAAKKDARLGAMLTAAGQNICPVD